jgi:hypothetical protein
MGGPERIEWRRGFPSHALAMLGWYLAVAVLLLGIVFLLFGGEPTRLASGRLNPLASVPTWTIVALAVGALPFVLAVARRPIVAANHFAVSVRPAWVRTLVLPWTLIGEVAVHEIDQQPYLLLRCRGSLGRLGDQPRWMDRSVLRSVLRDAGPDAPALSEFDLAVRMRDFVGQPAAQLSTLAAFAPDHVVVVNHADSG